MGKEKTKRLMAEFSAELGSYGDKISYEELEEMIEQQAREEEADSIALAEEHRIFP